MIKALKDFKHSLYLRRKEQRRHKFYADLRKRGVKIEGNPGIDITATILPDAVISKGCYVNRQVFIDGHVTLEENVFIGPRALLCTASHEVGPSNFRAGDNILKPIRVGKGSWIGQSVSVIAGVNIAPGCIIAAGSVVTKDTEPNGLYAGVPARRIRDL